MKIYIKSEEEERILSGKGWRNEKRTEIKKNPANQDSPLAVGRFSGMIPLRRSAIPAERFSFIGRTAL